MKNRRRRYDMDSKEIFKQIEEIENIAQWNELFIKREDGTYEIPFAVIFLFATSPACGDCIEQAKEILDATTPKPIKFFYIDTDSESLVYLLTGFNRPKNIDLPQLYFFLKGKRIRLLGREKGSPRTEFRASLSGPFKKEIVERLLKELYKDEIKYLTSN